MKKLLILIAVFAIFLMGGCVDGNIDGLYSLPQTQEKYQQLQALIDKEIDAGAEYSAPTGGTYRQSVQLFDIDGDGTEEALAFLKNAAGTPMVCVYRTVDGKYELASTIIGEGTYIGRVTFADLLGDGISDIIVSWKMSSGLTSITAYSLQDWSSAVLVSVNGTDFRTLEFGAVGTGTPAGLAVLNMGDNGGAVDLYFLNETGELECISAKLSSSMKTADRFRVQSIQGDVPAIIVEGHFEEESGDVLYLTDVLAYSGGKLKNITLDPKTEDSIAIRRLQIYSQDIDEDGAFDVPFSEEVYKQPDVTGDYYILDWITFSADGKGDVCASTYHAQSDGWYYVIPQEWREDITVRRDTVKIGEPAVVLSTVDSATKEVTDRLTIFSLTDENRNERARLPGRFTLAFSGTTIFAAKIEEGFGLKVSEEQKSEVIGRFHIITTEWTTGAV